MGGTEAFPDLGKHCSDPWCRQLDFLPFKCDACSKDFCLEHRSYTAHKCPKANFKDTTVVVCPFCASAVRKVVGEDVNLTLDKHLRSSCDPRNYDKVMKKPKCTVRGCKELLTTSNKFECKVCRKDVCLKHRFALDHDCKQPKKDKPSDLASKFMQALSFRNGSECGTSSSNSRSSSSTSKWPRIF